ncbi:MAG: nucleoside triphosphate pyrophosphatase [Desulfatirhabdiaceae bacterium]
MFLKTRHPLILASQSPRRRYLLKQAGLDFMVKPPTFDESTVPVLPPRETVMLLAKEKAMEIAGQNPDAWVIGADTIVVIDDQILGKPDSPSSARHMLNSLSGRTHQVLTAFSLHHVAENRHIGECVSTDVLFKPLSHSEIDWYIRTDEPFDKAGAYALQGIGAFMVQAVYGSYTNVIGLPVCELMNALFRERIIVLQDHPNS